MTASSNGHRNILLICVQNNLSIIGFKYIHYVLLKNGWKSRLLYLKYLDINDSNQMNNFQEFVSLLNPLFIGISLTSVEYYRARDISIFLKEKFPSIPILWGGVHPTIAPDTCFPHADYVCMGEGERSIIDFSEAMSSGKDVAKVHNLCYMENGVLKKNSLYRPLEDLDRIPWSDHVPVESYVQRADGKIYPLNKEIYMKEARWQGKMYELISSRGCPYSCTYCCNNYFVKLYPTNKKVRRRSAENIIAEIEQAISDNPDIDSVLFKDDSFLTCSKEYLSSFCTTYKNKINKPLIVSATPTSITPDRLKLLKEAGVSLLNIGLQSGSDTINREVYKRRALKKDFIRSAEMIHQYKIAGKYDVILDNPFEREDDIVETIETLIATPRPYIVEFFSLTLYPGTELYDRVLKECPDRMEDCCAKDYIKYKENSLNKMIVLAVYLPKMIIKRLLELYKAGKENSLRFKTALFVSGILSSIYFKPVSLFQVVKLSRGSSLVNTFMAVPMYIKDYLNSRNV